MSIPAEPIGGIPRPRALTKGVQASNQGRESVPDQAPGS